MGNGNGVTPRESPRRTPIPMDRLLLHQDTAKTDVVISLAGRSDVAEADGQPVLECPPGTPAGYAPRTPFKDIAAHVVKAKFVRAQAANVLGVSPVAPEAGDRIVQGGIVHIEIPLSLAGQSIVESVGQLSVGLLLFRELLAEFPRLLTGDVFDRVTVTWELARISFHHLLEFALGHFVAADAVMLGYPDHEHAEGVRNGFLRFKNSQQFGFVVFLIRR